ncbi:uncharacterized protein LOC117117803 [Anneissia japonica]|uniref:uncharacterized protein LOC117117803 n=1 Tax=Anneissia japonica TaxID=1529436 RepID=UPI001425B5CD|nr:uncharacterized protein LOC117117803 [Anneissia japonica]
MAREYGISDEHIDVAITYLSDVGEIMYHPMEEALKDLVVIQPMEIVKYFRTVFTIQDEQQWKPKFIDDWKRLKKGVLTKPLLKHLWKEFPILNDDDTMFNFFVNLMNKFGLICQKKKQNTASDDIAYYAVSHLQPKQYSEDPKDDQGDDKVSIFHDFCGFLPDYLFHLVITKFIEEFQVEEGYEPKLAYEYVKISIDDHHYVRIAVATINYCRMFKTTIVRRQKPNDPCVVEPSPVTCKKVLDSLNKVLIGLCSPGKGIKYKMCIPCRPSDKQHCMHIVETFNKNTVSCDDFVIPIERYCRLFGDASEGVTDMQSLSRAASSKQVAIQEMTVKQFNVLKMDVSEWYDSNQCLPMLKVLFRDHVEIGRLSGLTNTMELLNELVTRNHLHLKNIGILCDTISITEHNGLQQKIAKRLPSFPDVKDRIITKQFTNHRRKLMKCGMKLTSADVRGIDGLYNIPLKKYTDSWSMITDFENRMEIIDGDMEEFIDSLEILKIPLALNALKDAL